MFWWNKQKWVWIALLSLLIISCQETTESTDRNSEMISVSQLVDSFFNQNDSVRAVVKTLTVNEGQPESKNLENYNVYDDLRMLKEYDVSVPRWADFFEIGEMVDSSGMEKIQYSTDHEKAPAQEMIVHREKDTIRSVQIRSRRSTLISSQKVDVDWVIGEGYRLRNESKLLFQKPRIFQMDVEYRTVK